MDFPTGWTCERTLLQFEYYLLRTLPLAQALSVAEHLEACPECVQQLLLLRVSIRPRRG
jgi:Putative zinc-finger